MRRNFYGEMKYIPLWLKRLGWDEFLHLMPKNLYFGSKELNGQSSILAQKR